MSMRSNDSGPPRPESALTEQLRPHVAGRGHPWCDQQPEPERIDPRERWTGYPNFFRTSKTPTLPLTS